MRNFGAYRDLSLAMVIVGSSVVAGKHVVLHLPIHFSLGFRFLIACCLLVPLCRVLEGRLPRLSPRDWGVVFLQALCGAYLFNVLLLEGLKHVDAGAAGIVTSTTPACMALFSWLFLRERPARRVLLGIAASVLGLALLASPSAGGSGASLWGLTLVLGAVVCESLFLLLRKGLRSEISALGAATAVSLAGLVQFAPLALWQWREQDMAAISPATWGVLLYYGVFISALAYLLWFRGVVRVSGSVAAVFTALLPLSALGFAVLFLGEGIGLRHVAGCLCVLAAIGMLSGVKTPRMGKMQTGNVLPVCQGPCSRDTMDSHAAPTVGGDAANRRP